MIDRSIARTLDEATFCNLIMFASLPRLPALHRFAFHTQVTQPTTKLCTKQFTNPRLFFGVLCRPHRDYVQQACFSNVQAEQLLSELCRQHDIQSTVKVAQGQWGLGLYHRPQSNSQHAQTGSGSAHGVPAPAAALHQHQLHQQQPREQPQLLVSVPLGLVLSCSIPDCSPHPEQTPPALQQLLFHSCCSNHWEMQLAALLLWALRQPADSSVGGFWQRYVALLPPLQEQASLLLWSKQQLEELQDRELQETAEQWQQEVHAAFHTAVQPCFQRMANASSAAGNLQDRGLRNARQQSAAYVSSSSNIESTNDSSSSSGTGSSDCSLDEWLWAVAAVESRAFGIAKGGSSAPSHWTSNTDTELTEQALATAAASPGNATELVGMVPVLDLANHTCRSACHHAVNGTTATFNLYLDGSSSSSSGSAGAGSEMDMEVLISYGEKDNRQLMEQYGFCVEGNPFDRIQFERQQQQQWMSHTEVKKAAEHVKQQLVWKTLQQQQRQQQGEQLAAEGLQSCEASCVPNSQQRASRRYDGNQQSSQGEFQANDCGSSLTPSAGMSAAAAAATARVDAAVASIIAAAGWRNLRQYKQVTAGSTVACAEALLEQLQAFVSTYSTDIAEDEGLLKQLSSAEGLQGCQGGGSYHAAPPYPLVEPVVQRQHAEARCGRRLLAAVRYRLGQKLLVDAAQQILLHVIQQSGCE